MPSSSRATFARLVPAVLWSWLACAPAGALDRPIDQLQHTAWSIAEGSPPDVWALAQSPDGYLWLGTGGGLYRFDGIRFARVVPDRGSFPQTNIVALLVTTGGDLLIGYENGGVSLLSAGALTNYPGFPSAAVLRLVDGPSGEVWAASDAPIGRGGILHRTGGRWIADVAGLPPQTIPSDIAVDAEGAVWVLVEDRVYRRRRQGLVFEQVGRPLRGALGLAFSPGHAVWARDADGVEQVSPPDRPLLSRPAPREGAKQFFTRDGDLWSMTAGEGVLRLPRPDAFSRPAGSSLRSEFEIFGRKDGLTSDIVGAIFEDRERNVWIGTNLGLDRFRAASVVPERSVNPTSRGGYRIAPSADDGLVVAAASGLFEMDARGGLNLLKPGRPQRMGFCPASGDAIWLASGRSLTRWAQRPADRLPLPAGSEASQVNACQEDSAGRLWLSVWGSGVFRREKGGWRRLPEFDDLAAVRPAMLAADPGGGMWVYYLGHPLQLDLDGAVRSFGRREGLDVGGIGVIRSGPGGILVGGDAGLAWYDGHRFRSIRSDEDPTFARIAGIIQTPDGATWLNTLAGVVRLRSDQLRQAFAAGRWPAHRLFDRRDGLPGLAQQDSYSQTALAGRDGRLWFVTNHGLAWIDPRRLSLNTLPPPVRIETIAIGDRRFPPKQGLHLPQGSSNIEIDYTALSLRVPERVEFRYRLEGVDRGWVNPGTRRQAFYTRLAPGSYVFRVIAANDDGVWNREGATLRFSIDPRFTQTGWFLAVCLLLGLVLAALGYWLNLRRLSSRLRDRLEVRLQERERIARELHDTLLQGFQGLQLHFQSAAEAVPPSSRARAMLERALALADGVLGEARRRVRDMRSTGSGADLARDLRLKGDRLLGESPMKLSVVEEGERRSLDPDVEREVSAIAEEAMVNAVKHSRGHSLEARITHGGRQFRLAIADDGIGLSRHGPSSPDRFGLLGMQERARKISGSLTIRPRAGGGTEVALVLSGRAAYGRLRLGRPRSRPSTAARLQ